MGTRTFSNRSTAVSEARMPSLCSTRTTSKPGVPFSTTNDLIAARPFVLSRVAQTTTASARSPAVTKIFSPLITYSSPSSRAVAVIAAESEPQSGSVIAIAAHSPENFLSCSSVATEPMAALPSPWRGMDSSRPTSPQHISIVPSTMLRLEPLRLPGFSFFSDRRTPAAPAPPSPEEFSPSSSAANMSSSAG